MKILFVWSGLTGYMGDCWRELSQRDGVELKVAVDLTDRLYGSGFSADDVMRGLDWSQELPSDWPPDIVFIVGWRNKLCLQAAHTFSNFPTPNSKLPTLNSKLKLVCCFDMPWEWRLRKVAARFVLWRYLRRFDAAFVPGRAAGRYARWLGFGRRRIYSGLFATNVRRFNSHTGGNGFLFVGRDDPVKGTDVLRAAHAIYRARGGRWDLRIVSGVSPDELGPIYGQADGFILASRWEPWGVVLVEAAAAGLPIICTDRCGARHEVVKGNGVVVKANNAKALADAMLKVERGEAGIDGTLGRDLAKPYGCEAWADRVVSICNELCLNHEIH